jgi:uncharacterized small protein (DUF1192 family)
LLQQGYSCGTMLATVSDAMDAEDLPKKTHLHVIGEPLDAISVAELQLRIDFLKAEIARIETEMQRKNHSRAAADAFFKS